MTNWQFITIIGTFVLAFFGFILTILGAMRSIQTALSEQLNSFRNEMRAEITGLRSEMKADQAKVLSEIETLRNEVRQNDKRYEERFSRIEADIREIKNDIRQTLRLALPG